MNQHNEQYTLVLTYDRGSGFKMHTTSTTGAGLKFWQWPRKESTLKTTDKEQLHAQQSIACRRKNQVRAVSLENHTL